MFDQCVLSWYINSNLVGDRIKVMLELSNENIHLAFPNFLEIVVFLALFSFTVLLSRVSSASLRHSTLLRNETHEVLRKLMRTNAKSNVTCVKEKQVKDTVP